MLPGAGGSWGAGRKLLACSLQGYTWLCCGYWQLKEWKNKRWGHRATPRTHCANTECHRRACHCGQRVWVLLRDIPRLGVMQATNEALETQENPSKVAFIHGLC